MTAAPNSFLWVLSISEGRQINQYWLKLPPPWKRFQSPQPNLAWRRQRVIDKQWRPGSDAAEHGVLSGSSHFAHGLAIFL